MKTVGLNLFTLAVFVVLWTLIAEWQSSPFFATPPQIVTGFVQMVTVGDVEGYKLWTHLVHSIIRVFAGFGAACLLGIPGGLFFGLFPQIYARTRIIVEPIRFISPIAWIPMAIVLLIGFTRYIFVIWVASFFPIFVATLWSVRQVNPVHINVARVAGASRTFVIRKIVIPAVLPSIVGGMRVSLGISWMCIVAAEMIGGQMIGIGRLILKSAMVTRMDLVIVGMVSIGVIGYATNELIIKIEKHIFRWRAAVSIE
jgi:NitT/TauT family transport system permease protein